MLTVVMSGSLPLGGRDSESALIGELLGRDGDLGVIRAFLGQRLRKYLK
jgi:hypothetical protein